MQPGPDLAASCPHCNMAGEGRGPQRCKSCGKPFAFYLGYAADGSVVPPPPDMRAGTVDVRWANAFTYLYARLEAIGVASGMNDPVTGLIPLDQAGVMFPDIFTITIWRSIRWLQLVLAILVPLPIAIGCFVASISAPGALIVAVPFAALTVWAIYLATSVGKLHARIVGRYRVLDFRFDSPFWRRQQFHDELLRRAGVGHHLMP